MQGKTKGKTFEDAVAGAEQAGVRKLNHWGFDEVLIEFFLLLPNVLHY